LNLILIGYRGTGKSTIGRLLSERLEMPYVCFDEEIVRRAGLSIPEIVAAHSWEYFRDLESEVLEDCVFRSGQVLDTGGGVVTRPRNVEALRRAGLVFLLRADLAEIVRRIGSTQDRPSLTGTKSFTEEVEEVLAVRRPLYEAAADFVVDTSKLGAEEAAEEIAGLYLARVMPKP
jgi:shikimate kinase